MSTINNKIFYDTEDRYLKIYYPDSEKFVEFPLDDEDGKLLFIDVKVVEPNIYALNLIKPNNGGGKLYKPKNGCFKEPKEKWSYFKVIIVLKPSVNAITAKSPISDTGSFISSNINQLLPTNDISTENETIEKKKKIQHFNEDLSTPSTQSPIDSTLNSIENVSKKESKNTIQSSPTPSLQSINDVEIINSVEAVPSCYSAIITNAEIFAAYNVSSLKELKQLLCDGNSLFRDMFGTAFKLLRKTLIGHPNKDIVKVLYYAHRSNICLRTIDPNMPDVCKQCDKNFSLCHLLSRSHITTYQSIYNDDPPEISIILNPDNFINIIPAEELSKIKLPIGSYDFFTNVWYEKDMFDSLKGCIIYRVTKAKLNLSFKDSLFIEKLLFLRDAFNEHPNLKDIFPQSSYCKMCKKNLQNPSCVITHILSKDHITKSLNQNELDKFVHAVSFINYSDADGFYYNSVLPPEKRKRSHQREIALETPSKRHIIFSDSDS